MVTGVPVVLCVEDDADTQEMMEMMLEGWGYGYLSAVTCSEALEVIRAGKLAAVLLDNSLPDCTGIELCAILRRYDQRLPIIFLSGSAHGSERQMALDSGANEFLTKPFDFDFLRALLEKHIRAGN